MKNTTLCGKILHFVVNYAFCGTISHICGTISHFCDTISHFVVLLWYICGIFVIYLWYFLLWVQLLVAALLLLCLLSRDNPWRLCSSYVDISSTIGFPCTHLRRSILLIVLCLPRPSAGSITYTLLFPCFCITRYPVLSHASCILILCFNGTYDGCQYSILFPQPGSHSKMANS